ncbi:hypothetical protein KW801_01185 [Candidatus Saccharibacteria bacterium]|nr:hypothetical protein [Candidatus Saccharibacteria bacterium]
MTNKKPKNRIEIFINPAGFIEQHYYGYVSVAALFESRKELMRCVDRLSQQNQPILILSDLTGMKKTSAAARKLGMETMNETPYQKAAIYGPMLSQVMVKSLALVAGKQQEIKVFDDRLAAVKWLKSK